MSLFTPTTGIIGGTLIGKTHEKATNHLKRSVTKKLRHALPHLDVAVLDERQAPQAQELAHAALLHHLLDNVRRLAALRSLGRVDLPFLVQHVLGDLGG